MTPHLTTRRTAEGAVTRTWAEPDARAWSFDGERHGWRPAMAAPVDAPARWPDVLRFALQAFGALCFVGIALAAAAVFGGG